MLESVVYTLVGAFLLWGLWKFLFVTFIVIGTVTGFLFKVCTEGLKGMIFIEEKCKEGRKKLWLLMRRQLQA